MWNITRFHQPLGRAGTVWQREFPTEGNLSEIMVTWSHCKKTQEKTVADGKRYKQCSYDNFHAFFMSMFHMSMFPESYGCGMKVIFRFDLTVLLVHQINSGANEVWESWSPWYDDELFMLTYILQGFASMLRSLPLKISAKHKELTDVLRCRSVVEKIDDYHDRSTSWINVLQGFLLNTVSRCAKCIEYLPRMSTCHH